MDSTTNNGMCRCCASEGTYKDVISKYSWMGDEEIYSDMLKQCFDIDLCVSSDGDNGGICEVCITQLRNAANFKKQVLNTEEQFKKHLQEKLYKSNIVKVEVHKSEDIESDNNASDDYSAPEFEVPIKEEINEVAKPKKRAAAAKATSSSAAKKPKTEIGETSTKHVGGKTAKIEYEVVEAVSNLKCKPATKINNEINDWTVTIRKMKDNNEITVQQNSNSKKMTIKRPKVEIKKLEKHMHNFRTMLLNSKATSIRIQEGEIEEIEKHKHNVRTILLNSNATPIRRQDGMGYTCSFCLMQCLKPAKLKTHTLEKHDKVSISKFLHGYGLKTYMVKLDVTNLKCKICSGNIESLEQLMEHLTNEHDIQFYMDVRNHILPFKFNTDEFKCVVCTESFPYFKNLVEHMRFHYRNYICEICSSPYVTPLYLKRHMYRHSQGEFPCSFCSKIFSTEFRKSEHEKSIHVGDRKKSICPHCGERFKLFVQKLKHMEEAHGVRPPTLNCKACEKSFTVTAALTRHIKKQHLLEKRHECGYCDMKFSTKRVLIEHTVKHTGVKAYQCDICKKAYGRKHTLRQHMRIHTNDRRFKCERCGQTFIQKCSLKSHMKCIHGEINL